MASYHPLEDAAALLDGVDNDRQAEASRTMDAAAWAASVAPETAMPQSASSKRGRRSSIASHADDVAALLKDIDVENPCSGKPGETIGFFLSPELAAGIRRVKGAKRLGVRIGNWLTLEQGRTLLQRSGSDTLRGKRDRAILSVLLGCGLRRAELVALSVQDLQIREDHWVFADLIGKGKHIRTVPVPGWVKTALDDWTANADITGGNIFRRVNKNGVVWGEEISPKAIWHVVKRAAQRAGIHGLAPHDLRRTCARLCHLAGGELEQIQFLLGHVSVETTERYLGCKQKLRDAVNDQLGSGRGVSGRLPEADFRGVR